MNSETSVVELPVASCFLFMFLLCHAWWGVSPERSLPEALHAPAHRAGDGHGAAEGRDGAFPGLLALGTQGGNSPSEPSTLGIQHWGYTYKVWRATRSVQSSAFLWTSTASSSLHLRDNVAAVELTVYLLSKMEDHLFGHRVKHWLQAHANTAAGATLFQPTFGALRTCFWSSLERWWCAAESEGAKRGMALSSPGFPRVTGAAGTPGCTHRALQAGRGRAEHHRHLKSLSGERGSLPEPHPQS